MQCDDLAMFVFKHMSVLKSVWNSLMHFNIFWTSLYTSVPLSIFLWKAAALRWALTIDFRYQTCRRGICVENSGTRTGFLRVLWFYPVSIIPRVLCSFVHLLPTIHNVSNCRCL